MKRKVVAVAAAFIGVMVIAYIATGVMGLRGQQIIIRELGASTGVEDSMFDDNAENNMITSEDAGIENTDSQKGNVSAGNQAAKPSGGDAAKPLPAPGKMDYESFHDMSPEKQQEYMESFKDMDAFFKWYNKAKDTYEKENPAIEIGGGIVDLK